MRGLAMCAALVFVAGGCGQNERGPLDDVLAVSVNSLSGDLSVVEAGKPPRVEKSAVQVGSAPSQILPLGGELAVLSSTSNSLEVIDPKSWEVIRQYALGDGCNPMWMAPTAESKLVVTCWLSNELLLVDPRADLAANPVLKRMDMPTGEDLLPYEGKTPYARPQGVAVVGHRAYVALNNTGDDYMPAGPALLLVVDVQAWTQDQIIELSGHNAFGVLASGCRPGSVWVSCAGAFDASGVVDRVDTTTGEVAESVAVGGAPGALRESARSGLVWVSNMLDGSVLGFDCESPDPFSLMVCPSDYDNGVYNFVADVAPDGRGNLYVACFATDAIEVLEDSAQMTAQFSIEVGDGPQALFVVQR